MRHTTIVRTFALILPLAFSFALPLAAQDSQNTSVAEAARRSREQKKASAKPATIITDETLKPAPSSSPANPPAGQSPAATAPGASAPAGSSTDQNAPAAADEAEKKKKDVEALKQEVAALQGEVDLAQRSLSLDQDALYSKPDFSNDKAGKAKLDAEQADLKQKQDALAQLKAKFAALGGVEEPKTPPPPAKP
jgi:hypothetical protein